MRGFDLKYFPAALIFCTPLSSGQVRMLVPKLVWVISQSDHPRVFRFLPFRSLRSCAYCSAFQVTVSQWSPCCELLGRPTIVTQTRSEGECRPSVRFYCDEQNRVTWNLDANCENAAHRALINSQRAGLDILALLNPSNP